jgi:hypothetical protein
MMEPADHMDQALVSGRSLDAIPCASYVLGHALFDAPSQDAVLNIWALQPVGPHFLCPHERTGSTFCRSPTAVFAADRSRWLCSGFRLRSAAPPHPNCSIQECLVPNRLPESRLCPTPGLAFGSLTRLTAFEGWECRGHLQISDLRVLVEGQNAIPQDVEEWHQRQRRNA